MGLKEQSLSLSNNVMGEKNSLQILKQILPIYRKLYRLAVASDAEVIRRLAKTNITMLINRNTFTFHRNNTLLKNPGSHAFF